jgi:hypothetical protein
MKIALTLSALALSLAPGLAFAQCSGNKVKEETASSCVPGSTWDPVTATCTATPSS